MRKDIGKLKYESRLDAILLEDGEVPT